MKRNIVTADYESYWSPTYSLNRLTPIEYVMGDEFEAISLALKVNNAPTQVAFGREEIYALLDTVDWTNAIHVAHNGAEFDNLISAWHFGINPYLWADTLQMARPEHGRTVGGSLKALAKHYGLEEKGDLSSGVLGQTKGKHLADFTAEEIEAMRVYNQRDTDITYELFRILAQTTEASELRLMDATARMLTEPKFVADLPLLKRGLKAERKRKARNLAKLSVELDLDTDALKKTLGSAPKFKAFLETRGVDCPVKISPTTGKAIPALAKTDKGMTDLLEHTDPIVASAAEERLNVKSSILETRLERFIDAARLCHGKMPIALRYCGAQTTWRWSGKVAKLNQQNLPRINPYEPKISDVLRLSMQAPEGQRVVVVDLSAIEMRANHFLWQVQSSMAAYQANKEADLYRLFAAEHLYHCAPEDITKVQRQRGKVAQLQLGYQSGWAKLKERARIDGIHLTDDEAKRITETWREAYKPIVRGWWRLDRALSDLAVGNNIGAPLDPGGLVRIEHGALRTPKGLIRYPNLRQELVTDDQGNQRDQWFYGDGRNKANIYGGKCTENLIQCLSRFVMSDAILKFKQTKLGKKYDLAHTVHDELIYVVDEDDAEAVLETLIRVMTEPPEWWPDLILSAEGGIARTYGGVDK